MRFSDGGQLIMDSPQDINRILRGLCEAGLSVRVSGQHFTEPLRGRLVSVESRHHRFRTDPSFVLPPVPVLTSATLTVELNAGQVQWNAPVISCRDGTEMSLGTPEMVVTGRCRASYRAHPHPEIPCRVTLEQGDETVEGDVLDVSFEGMRAKFDDLGGIDRTAVLWLTATFQSYSCRAHVEIRWVKDETVGLALVDEDGVPLAVYPEPWVGFVRRVAYSSLIDDISMAS